MPNETTRRALFAGATTLALSAPIAAVAAPLASAPTFTTGSDISPLWIERDRLFNAESETDEAGDATFDQMAAVENRILLARHTSVRKSF